MANFFWCQSIGIDETNTFQLTFFSSMNIFGATSLCGLWVLEWAWQTFFESIDRYEQDKYISVKIFYLALKLWAPQTCTAYKASEYKSEILILYLL